jgi:polyphosphate kinase
MIDALYEAAAAGVPIDLLVRGICCLRPGVRRLSERIRVVSVVGRFLEHSRILWFENGGAPEAFLGSADLMGRNLDRRIETLVPVERSELRRHLRDDILARYLADTGNTWEMQPDGTYRRRVPRDGAPRFVCQEWLMQHPSTKSLGLDDLGE